MILQVVHSLRPSQWTKNVFVFAGLIFGLQLGNPTAVWRACAAFGVFCLLSGVVYLVNDIRDRDADRLHPVKARRPIASGALSPAHAAVAALILSIVAVSASFALGSPVRDGRDDLPSAPRPLLRVGSSTSSSLTC